MMRPTEQVDPRWWRNERTVTTYRFSWLRLYAIMAAWEAVLLVLVAVVIGHVASDIFAGLLLMALLIVLLASLAMALTFTIHVGETGIQGHNLWGNRSRMRWEEIEAAVPSQMLGLPWLKVRARNSRSVMWLPLFFASRRAFYENVARFAPPSCPILPPYGKNAAMVMSPFRRA
jgi:hypothetical protein